MAIHWETIIISLIFAMISIVACIILILLLIKWLKKR